MNNFKYFIKIDLENLCGNPLYRNGYYDYDFPVDFKRHFLEFDNRNDFIIVCLNHFLKERDPYDYVNLEKLLQTINNSKRG